jgi:predicted nuclease with TOPRIM domain
LSNVKSEVGQIRAELEEVKHKLENIDRKVSRLNTIHFELQDKVEDMMFRLEKVEQKLAA